MLGVFYCSEKGQAILRNSPARLSGRGAGRLPGKPEQNAVPRKGDNMALARAGKGFQPPAYIFIVHTAAPIKGAAAFFSSTYFCQFPDQITKGYIFLLRAHLPFCGCAFFSRSVTHIFRHSGVARHPSSPENCFSKFQDWRET